MDGLFGPASMTLEGIQLIVWSLRHVDSISAI